jgi:hypothetical protein
LPVHRLHTSLCVLAAASLAACVSGPPPGSSSAGGAPAAQAVWQPPAPGLDFLRLTMDGAVPLLGREGGGDALLASNLALGADDVLRYEASYLVESPWWIPRGIERRS